MAQLSRRNFLGTGLALGAASLAQTPAAAQTAAAAQRDNFRFALNAATIRGYQLPLSEQIDLALKAGYEGFEPWVEDIARAKEQGVALADLRQRCADGGLQIVSAIGFAQWAVNDNEARARGLEQMRRDMLLVAAIGGTHIAAAPAGVNQAGVKLSLEDAAERYHAVLELGRQCGVVPQLEFWGAAANLARLDECVAVAARAAHPDACILADAYHMYRGGSDAATLRLLGGNALHCFHMNDYPATPARTSLNDSDRIWPGDGIAPFGTILANLRLNHARPWLSLELFNAAYWRDPVMQTLHTGLAKMRAVVDQYSQ